MRRSCIGRDSVSRGRGRTVRGTMTSCAGMAYVSMGSLAVNWLSARGVARGPETSAGIAGSGLGPAVKAAYVPLGVGIGAWGQFHKPVGPRQAGNVAGAVGGGGNGPGTAPVILLQAHGQEVGERGRDAHRGAQGDALGRRGIVAE